MQPLPNYTQEKKIDLNEHHGSFAKRIRQAKEYAAWLETLGFQMHVTGNFNRTTTHQHGREKLKLWGSRIERKLFGARYYTKSHEERIFFVAIPETSGASQNLHYHMLVRMPLEKHDLFEQHAPGIWKDFNPIGSLHIQKIGQTEEDHRKVISYDLKDGWMSNSSENIIISTEFSNRNMFSFN